MNKESFLYVVVFTFAVTFLFVFLLTAANVATADRVKTNQELVTAEAALNAAGVAPAAGEDPLAAFKRVFGSDPAAAGDPSALLRARVNGEDVLVQQFAGQGLWGTITGMLAVKSDVSRIVGLDIISHSETPGLGARIEEAWFKDQFRGELIPAAGITVRKGDGSVDANHDNGVVDGITGATLTSTSMQVMLNAEISRLRKEAAK